VLEIPVKFEAGFEIFLEEIPLTMRGLRRVFKHRNGRTPFRGKGPSAGSNFQYEVKRSSSVSDLQLLYIFLGLMGVNIFASVVYFTGFRHLRSTFRRRMR